jgi:hypothetical protein
MVTTIVVIASLLWSYYNIILIKIKGDRRGSQVSICFDKDMANLFHIDPDVVEKMKDCPSVSVIFNQNDISFKTVDLGAFQGK